MRLCASLLLALLCGCASMSRETAIEEATYQAVSAVDMAETLRIAHSDGLWDENNPTLGQRPCTRSVVTYFVLTRVGHLAITAYASDHNVPQWMLRLWEGLGITEEGIALHINAREGIRP